MFVIKLLHKLARRVIDDGAVAARVDLVEHLADDARLARSGVAHDQEMLVLRIARDSQRELESSVLIPIPLPMTAAVNSFGFTSTGPLRRRRSAVA